MSTEDPRPEVLPTILSDGPHWFRDFNYGYVYVMSLGETSLKALKSQYCLNSQGHLTQIAVHTT